jgi:hypothetical protein
LREQANAARSEKTKQQPRTEDGKRLASGGTTESGTTSPKKRKGHQKTALAKAAAAGVDRGTVENVDAVLLVSRPDMRVNVRNFRTFS